MSSTMTPQDTAAPAGTTGAPRAFRGRSLEEILPQIREALGDDAIILRQREGLSGGVGGFFQQRFVEVEAVAGLVRGSFDAYDSEPAFPDDEPLAAAPARAPLPSGRRVEVRDDTPAPAPVPAAPRATEPAATGPAEAAAPAQPTTELDGPAFLRHLDAALRRREDEAPADATAPAAEAPASVQTPAPVAAPAPVEAAAPAPVAPAPVEPRLVTYKPTRARIVKAASVTETAAATPAAPVVEAAPAAAAPAPVAPTTTEQPAAVAEAPAPAPAIKPWAPKRTAVRDGGARALAGIAAAPEHLQVTVPAEPAADEEEPAAPRRRDVRVSRPAGTATAPATPATPTVDLDIAEYVLVSRGLTPEIARPVVREAVVAGGDLDVAARELLAARLPVVADRTDVRTIAVAGGPGSGRTSAVGALCRAYVAEHRSVLVVALRPTDGGAALRAAVAGTRAQVFVAQDGDEIARVRDARDADVCLIDTPVVRKGRAKLIATVAADLRAAGADEVHLAVPGTDAAVGVTATVDAFAELGADALLMTHRDLADRPGGIVSGAILRRLPVSYVTDGQGIALADPAGLARMVRP